MKSPRKNSLTPPPHKYYIQNMLWVMDRDFYFSTADIHTAMDVMKEADSRITKEFENEFKSIYSSSKSIDWKDMLWESVDDI